MMDRTVNRRQFLTLAGASAAGLAAQSLRPAGAAPGQAAVPVGAADHTLRIGTGLIEAAPDKILSVKTYNGGFPGPLLRLKEGRKVTVDVGCRSRWMARRKKERPSFPRGACAVSNSSPARRASAFIIRAAENPSACLWG